MKIGVDIDGVLANFVDPFLKYIEQKKNLRINKTDIDTYHPWQKFGISKDEMQILIEDFYVHEMFKQVEPLEGSKEGIDFLHKMSRLHIITARDKNLVGDNTKQWLAKHFGQKFSSINFSRNVRLGQVGKSKAEMGKNLDLSWMIEDSIEIAQKCSQIGIKVILIDQPWNQGKLPTGVLRVKDLSEVAKIPLT